MKTGGCHGSSEAGRLPWGCRGEVGMEKLAGHGAGVHESKVWLATGCKLMAVGSGACRSGPGKRQQVQPGHAALEAAAKAGSSCAVGLKLSMAKAA